jgi:hypothetical protein
VKAVDTGPSARWQHGTNLDWVGRMVEAARCVFRKYVLGPLGTAAGIGNAVHVSESRREN